MKKRLWSRAKDTKEVVRKRLRGASKEIKHRREYDFVIVNRNIERSVRKVQAILTAERQRRTRLIGLDDFVQNLLAGL